MPGRCPERPLHPLEAKDTIVKLPFTGKPALGCPTCSGTGKVVMASFGFGGKKLVSRKCPSGCRNGTLRRR